MGVKEMMQESIDCKNDFIDQADNIQAVADKIIESLKNGGKVLLCGNGGSAADCQHIAGEFVGRFKLERKSLPAIALTTDTSILTAWSNDYEFESVFARQVEALGKQGDVLIGISTSGNSKNIVKAFEKGKEIGTVNISLTGNDGGVIKQVSDLNINVNNNSTPRIQECHVLAYHIFCGLVEKGMIN